MHSEVLQYVAFCAVGFRRHLWCLIICFYSERSMSFTVSIMGMLSCWCHKDRLLVVRIFMRHMFFCLSVCGAFVQEVARIRFHFGCRMISFSQSASDFSFIWFSGFCLGCWAYPVWPFCIWIRKTTGVFVRCFTVVQSFVSGRILFTIHFCGRRARSVQDQSAQFQLQSSLI